MGQYQVVVKNACSCFFRSGMFEVKAFESAVEAKTYAEATLQEMQNTFCSKHQFRLLESFDGYTFELIISSR